jgi:hypothetical protein
LALDDIKDVEQIYGMIGTDTSIIDRYGIVLSSRIPRFQKGRLISPTIWSIIQKKKQLASELEIESIDGLVLESEQFNIVFTFGTWIYLLTQVPKSVDLSQYMPSINRIISTLDKSTDKTLTLQFQSLNFEEEYNQMKSAETEGAGNSMPIFKSLIKHMAKKK